RGGFLLFLLGCCHGNQAPFTHMVGVVISGDSAGSSCRICFRLSLAQSGRCSSRRMPMKSLRFHRVCSPSPRQVAYTARPAALGAQPNPPVASQRSEEHTSELQSRFDLVCRLLLEKKNREAARRDERRTKKHT